MPKIAIVGATGAVGEEMIRCLEQRSFPIDELRLLASARSAGKRLHFRDDELEVRELTHNSFTDIDIALFSAGGSISRTFAPSAASAGAIVIDNSSTFRMDDDVPLVIPEINPTSALQHPRNIIANPNCTTIVALMAIAPLHHAFGVTSVLGSSYQAVSGSGAMGIHELQSQMEQWTASQPIQAQHYPRQILSNVIPLIGSPTDNGYTDEEMKLHHEGGKILNHPDLRAAITCVRVPVFRSHSVSLTIQCRDPITPDAARETLGRAAGIRVVDDPAHGIFPTPLDCSHGDDCLVGRIRTDLVLDNAIALWVVGDQVRKGAALNAVQIAELLLAAPSS